MGLQRPLGGPQRAAEVWGGLGGPSKELRHFLRELEELQRRLGWSQKQLGARRRGLALPSSSGVAVVVFVNQVANLCCVRDAAYGLVRCLVRAFKALFDASFGPSRPRSLLTLH